MHDSMMATPVERHGRLWPRSVRERLLAGTSFKHEYLRTILDEEIPGAFFEVHAENYMGAGGPPHRALTALREAYPLSIHGVGMSIGAPGPLDEQHLSRFAALVKRYAPALVSEHLAWSSHEGTFYNDLLPLPYTKQTLQVVCAHIDQVQTAIGLPLLLENPSTYLRFDSPEMTEAQFLCEVVRRTGCGLLLDVNNVYVSATNHGFRARDYMLELPLEAVGEIHLAGHSEQHDDEEQRLLIDSHDRAVAPEVWALYADVLELAGPIPTLIEWDSNLPSWAVLKAQAQRARRHLTDRQAQAASHAQGRRHDT